MKIIPNKTVLGKAYELCPGFEPQDRFKDKEEVECSCLWCKHGEFYSGAYTVSKTGGCVCQAGQDPEIVGSRAVELVKPEE